MTKKFVIIGGVAGGMSAATRLRRLNEEAEIIVFERGPQVSFANCGLPYYVGGEISKREALIVQSSKALKQRFNLDIRENSEVIEIDPQAHKLTVRYQGQTYAETYDQLILSPGASPFIPPIEGLDSAKNVFSLRNIPDVDKIMEKLSQDTPKKAVVIGAGFIGLEMAENLAKRGLEVTIIEKAPHLLPPLDQEMAAFVANELTKNGLSILTQQAVIRFEDAGRSLILEDGTRIESDLTLLSVGVQPENKLAKNLNIELGLRGGILVDENYETSQKDIFAVGDAIVVKNQINNSDALIALASPANRQGRQVADVLSGLVRKNKGSIGTAILRVFGLVVASTGLSEYSVQQQKLSYKAVHISANDHAGYFPDASSIQLKLIFNPLNGKIYGAQAVGQKGVDKRIDILATAIKGNLTVEDLPELELTYAPPFGSAKDPVNMIGYAALNIVEGLSDNLQWHELEAALAQGKILLDVRTPQEFARGRFQNSMNIPLDELRGRLSELDINQDYIVSCQSGLRSYNAERLLRQKGFKVQNLDGAYGLYQTVTNKLLED